MSNRRWRFLQFLWPSQKTWTLKQSFNYVCTYMKKNWANFFMFKLNVLLYAIKLHCFYGYLSTIFHILNGLALLAFGWQKHLSTNKQNKESCDFDLSIEKTQKISDWHQSILTCHKGLKLFPNEHSYFYTVQSRFSDTFGLSEKCPHCYFRIF